MYSVLTARIILNIRVLGSRTVRGKLNLNELHTGYNDQVNMPLELEKSYPESPRPPSLVLMENHASRGVVTTIT